MAASTYFSTVEKLYIAFYQRPADPAGLLYWSQIIDAAGGNASSVVNAFATSAEATALYGPITSSTIGTVVDAIYQALFNHTADTAGKAFYVNGFTAGTFTAASIALNVLNGALGSDAVSVANKTTVATSFTQQVDGRALTDVSFGTGTGFAVTYNGDDLTKARDILKTVDANPANTLSATQVASVLQTQIANVGDTILNTAASSIVLTTGVDSKVGGAGNDTFDGSRFISNGTTADTWNNADSVDGGAGTNTLFAQLNASVSPAGFKNIQVLNIEAQSTPGAGVVVDLNVGDANLTTVKSTNSGTNPLVVQNIQSAPTNFSLTNTSGNFIIGVVTSKLAGTADAAQLDLSNVTAGGVGLGTMSAGSGYETITVNSIGSVPNLLTGLSDGNGTSLATVKVIGSQDLTLPLIDTTVVTVDASTYTGKLTLTVAGANTQNMAITGGTANDIINLNGTYTSSDVINGGNGTDRLTLTNAEATGATVAQTNVTNIEVIGLSDGVNGTVAVNNFAATSLRFGADMAGNSLVNYAAGTAGLDLQNRVSGAFSLTATIAGTATNDVLNLTVGSATAGNAFGNGAVTINGAETVNLVSQGGANSFGSTFTITDTAATQALVITGSQSLTFTGAVRADSIDASAMTSTAALTLSGGTGTTATTITGTANGDLLFGSTAGDIINGGAGNDIIANVITGVSATAADVLTGGTGFDAFILRGDLASGTVATVLNQAPLITDFTVGATATATDILTLSATNTNYTAAGTFFAGVAAAAAGSTSIQTVAQNAAATAAVTGTDLVKLTTGVSTAGQTFQQAFNTAIGTGTITGVGAGKEVFFTVYDTTNSRMEVGIVYSFNGTDGVVESGDVVTLVGSVAMSATDYASFSAANLAIVAA